MRLAHPHCGERAGALHPVRAPRPNCAAVGSPARARGDRAGHRARARARAPRGGCVVCADACPRLLRIRCPPHDSHGPASPACCPFGPPLAEVSNILGKACSNCKKCHELLNGEKEKRKRMAAAARPRTTGSRLRLLAVCAALLAGGALGAGDDASSCARRIRGEGEESTLVILKPDAVREHQLAESEGVETSACVRAAPARSSTAVAGALDLPAGAVSPGGPRTRGRGDLAVRASRPGARRDSGPARCLRCCLGLAPARRRIASCALADAHAVRAFALRTLPRAAGRPRPRRPPRFSRSTTGSTHSASSTRSSSTRWPPER